MLDAAGGSGNSGHNICQTLLDDAASLSIQTVSSINAPFTGVYRPLSPLAAFIGENPTGTWTLHVSDSYPADGGYVRAFSLYTSGYSCTP